MLTINKATHTDIPSIADIERLCFSKPWSENALRDSLNAGTVFYVVLYNNNIVGYMGISMIAGEGYVTNIAILPDFRRKGFAERLLSTVISDCRQKLEFISLEVRASNDAAISLYKKLGFSAVGCRKRFYVAPVEDALIMTKTFGD